MQQENSFGKRKSDEMSTAGNSKRSCEGDLGLISNTCVWERREKTRQRLDFDHGLSDFSLRVSRT